MIRFHFPHISRLFSANKSLPVAIALCWSVLTACIIINIRVSSTYGSVVKNVTDIMTKTTDTALNRSLSDWFDRSGIPGVGGEIRLSKTSPATAGNPPSGGSGVLGAQTQTVEYWKKILAERPDYRDGYIAAAKSALSKHNTEEAVGFIQQAPQIDPNDRTALVLLTLLEKNMKK